MSILAMPPGVSLRSKKDFKELTMELADHRSMLVAIVPNDTRAPVSIVRYDGATCTENRWATSAEAAMARHMVAMLEQPAKFEASRDPVSRCLTEANVLIEGARKVGVVLTIEHQRVNPSDPMDFKLGMVAHARRARGFYTA